MNFILFGQECVVGWNKEKPKSNRRIVVPQVEEQVLPIVQTYEPDEIECTGST